MRTVKKRLRDFLFRHIEAQMGRRGYNLVHRRNQHGTTDIDSDTSFMKVFSAYRTYSLGSVERAYAMYMATRYVAEAKIPGSIVECGVWRGGSMMIGAATLRLCNDTDRWLYLYDTYEGMTLPTDRDVDLQGKKAIERMREAVGDAEAGWGGISLEEVKKNLELVDYPQERMTFVKGDVLHTIPSTIPDRIALLRLDTDWYESTRHELLHLYPRLSPGGVLIIDDYGHYRGAKEAVDEFIAAGNSLLLTRIDYTGRMAVKVAG